ncbi:hypothetical protein EV361DRAFT_946857 [Lentinula raphanica]|uniref:Uncharacterized protein n=1 Tax=Lentinula raphanica TaxID=153919 RepID=A0AA38P183_9AGAR|nr:hypothetical protein C8R42DRAFT_718055 [Lentinula raphanica]KAJ3834424.1 hypothetical protein F5878DRAFT_664781 [Lentinula raphanica]KAJ3974668.1 hypothetical protein EV361DRAFT_946857 [Lentinula raphanica]
MSSSKRRQRANCVQITIGRGRFGSGPTERRLVGPIELARRREEALLRGTQLREGNYVTEETAANKRDFSSVRKHQWKETAKGYEVTLTPTEGAAAGEGAVEQVNTAACGAPGSHSTTPPSIQQSTQPEASTSNSNTSSALTRIVTNENDEGVSTTKRIRKMQSDAEELGRKRARTTEDEGI